MIWKYTLIMTVVRKRIGFRALLIFNCVLFFLIYRYGSIKQKILNIDTEKLYISVLQIRAGFESTTNGDGSSFSLGEFTPTISGFLSQTPKAINAVLFRPYIWESKKIFSLIAALESASFFIFTIFIVFSVGIKSCLRSFISNADILFCFFFTLLFSAALGISVSNFGALVRFKIQFMPFFVIGLLLLKYKKTQRTELQMIG